jgi:hypothetical protein
MIDFVAEEKTWVVLTERVELIPVEIDQQFTSSQVCEIYDNEEEAHNRMIELDPEWEDSIVI